MISQKLAQKINQGLHSHYPVLYISGREEDRIEATLFSMASKLYEGKQGLISWSSFQGFSDTHDKRDPLEALQHIASAVEPGMYLLKDFPVEFDNPAVVRAVRDLYYTLKGRNIYVFFSYPTIKLPDILSNEVYLIEMPLPSETEIHSWLQHLIDSKGLQAVLTDSLMHEYVVAMLGLTIAEIEHLFMRLLRSKDQDFEKLLTEVHEEKARILKKESVLQFVPVKQSLEQIGGLENLKEWVLQRKHLFTEEAFNSGLPLPSGILFMGVSGCGKSMAAKAIASAWNVPLVRLDMSLVLSGAYGQPEMAFEHATRVAEEISPVVLWIDELENSFGYDEIAPGEGNINVFSSFLTWMQDKSPKIFLAATANRIKQLPAELMRKGRFDQLFFLDLPTKQEREQILKIHIALQGGDPDKFELGYLAAITKEWSGAEIEQAVKSARIDAYQENREFTEQDIANNTSHMVPLAQTMSEQIKEIKNWSFKRAVPASAVEE